MPLELILVDDGSGDGTRELMEQLQARFKPNWVRLLLRDVNAGAATARNAGWDLASGDYVAFLDADDAWHPRKIEIQFGYMESHPEIVISGHQHRQISAHDARDASIDRLVFRMVSKRYILFKNPFVTPSFMIRRNVGVRFLAGRRFMEDHLLLMQIVMVGGQVAKADFCLAYLFKPIYGHSGLSASMLQMQLAELDNYKLLHSKGAISIFEYGFFCFTRV